MTLRDLFAGAIAIGLALVGLSLATTLQRHRKRRRRARDAERALGRTIVAEIPAAGDFALFSEDDECFHYGGRAIDKDLIVAVRVLVNGAPIAACVSTRHAAGAIAQPTGVEDRPEGIARDRWDVVIETVAGSTLVECGAIRERVSQELARAVFGAVKGALERRDTEGRGSARR